MTGMLMQERLNATLQSVSEFSQQLENYLAELTIHDRTSVTLAMQELLVNIVSHSYAGQSGQIDIEIHISEGKLAIEVRDYSSTVFSNPEQINVLNPVDLPEHGMGLFIIHQSFDDVSYKRVADVNLWQLAKRLET
ncbi:MAG: ATP-binding protein [Anaerolineae bacterium]